MLFIGTPSVTVRVSAFFLRIILMPFDLWKVLADDGAIYMCTYTCMHACMHACMHTYIHAYIHTYIQATISHPSLKAPLVGDDEPWSVSRYSKTQALSAKNVKLHSPNLP